MSLGCFKSECSFLGKRTNKPVTLRPVEHTVLNLHLTSLTIKKSIVNWKDNANDGHHFRRSAGDHFNNACFAAPNQN